MVAESKEILLDLVDDELEKVTHFRYVYLIDLLSDCCLSVCDIFYLHERCN